MDNSSCKDNKCETITRQNLEVNTPVKLKPVVDIGRIKIVCCEPKVIHSRKNECPNRDFCEFIIRQNINIEVPIKYQVNTDIKESFVDCDKECNKDSKIYSYE